MKYLLILLFPVLVFKAPSNIQTLSDIVVDSVCECVNQKIASESRKITKTDMGPCFWQGAVNHIEKLGIEFNGKVVPTTMESIPNIIRELEKIAMRRCKTFKELAPPITGPRSTSAGNMFFTVTSPSSIPVAKRPDTEYIPDTVDTRTVKFDLFTLYMPDMAPNEDIAEHSSDTVETGLELGEFFSEQMLQIQNIENSNIDSIKVFESYRTVLSIMDEGPHLELYDWKGYESGWFSVQKIGLNAFKTRLIPNEDSKQFPKFRRKELAKAADKISGGKRWGNLIRKPITGYWKDAYWIGIGINRLKIELYQGNKKTSKIIILYAAMGC